MQVSKDKFTKILYDLACDDFELTLEPEVDFKSNTPRKHELSDEMTMKTLTPHETHAVVGGRSLGFVEPSAALDKALRLPGLGEAHPNGSEGTPHLTRGRLLAHPSTLSAGQD